MAYMIDVFTLTGKEMTDEGNFFAAMFVALAGACLFSYYAMGWGTNTLAQVSNTLWIYMAMLNLLIKPL